MNLLRIAKNYFSLSEELYQLKETRSKVQNRHNISPYNKISVGPEAKRLYSLYTQKISQTEQQLEAVDDAISHCKRPEVQQILRRFYTQGETLEAIAETMYICMTTANRLKAVGVKELTEYRPIENNI